MDIIKLTPEAIEQLRGMLANRASTASAGLRLAIERGGCAGAQYTMRIAEPESGDSLLEVNGARVIVAADSLELLRGSTIDYVDDLSDAGFKIDNPNAARNCGCGTSFEPAKAGQEPKYEPAMDGTACGEG